MPVSGWTDWLNPTHCKYTLYVHLWYAYIVNNICTTCIYVKCMYVMADGFGRRFKMWQVQSHFWLTRSQIQIYGSISENQYHRPIFYSAIFFFLQRFGHKLYDYKKDKCMFYAKLISIFCHILNRKYSSICKKNAQNCIFIYFFQNLPFYSEND